MDASTTACLTAFIALRLRLLLAPGDSVTSLAAPKLLLRLPLSGSSGTFERALQNSLAAHLRLPKNQSSLHYRLHRSRFQLDRPTIGWLGDQDSNLD